MMQMNHAPSEVAKREAHPTVIIHVSLECWNQGRANYQSDTDAYDAFKKRLKSLRNVSGIRKSIEEGYALDVLVQCPSLCATEDVRQAVQDIYNQSGEWMKGDSHD